MTFTIVWTLIYAHFLFANRLVYINIPSFSCFAHFPLCICIFFVCLRAYIPKDRKIVKSWKVFMLFANDKHWHWWQNKHTHTHTHTYVRLFALCDSFPTANNKQANKQFWKYTHIKKKINNHIDNFNKRIKWIDMNWKERKGKKRSFDTEKKT